MRRATLALALVPVIAGPAAGALAATTGPGGSGPTISQPAPPADSHATAVTIDDLLKIGDTGSHAGSDGGSATASALEVGGQNLIDGKTGGSQKGPGTSKGSLLDTGSTPLGSLALTPWTASAGTTDCGSNSAADAALAHATVIDSKTLDVWLMHSRSASSWCADQSSSTSSSDGASANAGDGALKIVLLHSESQSGHKGSSTLLSVNGNDIGSSDQLNGQCVLSVPQVATLTCVDASGGKGSNDGKSTADTATATLGSSNTPQGSLTSTDATGTSAPTKVEGEKLKNSSGGNSSGPNAEADRTPNGGLPFTGFRAGLLSTYGAALLALGAGIARVGRRRRFQHR